MLAHGMVHTYEMSIPILVTIWLAEFSTTTAVLGGVVTVGYALFGVGALPGGMLADRFGSRRLIAVCLIGMALSFAALGVVGWVALPDVALIGLQIELWLITLALLFWGVAASVYHPSGLSLISTGVERRGTGFAYHGIAGNLGIALGPLATILMLEVLPWEQVVVALAVPSLLAAVYALAVNVDERAAVDAQASTVETDGGSPDTESDDGAGDTGGGSKADAVTSLAEFKTGTIALFSGTFVAIFGIVVLSGLYYRGVLTFLPEILGDIELFQELELGGEEFDAARYAYVGILMIGVIGQYAGGRLTERLRPEVGLAASFAVLAVLILAFLPASEAGTVPLLVVGGLLGVFLFVVQPMYQAAVAEYTPAGTRGLSYGYTYLGVFGFGALGGAIAGWLLTFGTGLLFGVLAVFAALASAIGLAVTLGIVGE